MYWRLKYFIILKYNEFFKKNFLKHIFIDVSKNNNFFHLLLSMNFQN